MNETVSINLSKEYALKLAHYLHFVQVGQCVPLESVEEVNQMNEITTEVINQVADAFPENFGRGAQ